MESLLVASAGFLTSLKKVQTALFKDPVRTAQ
jgi:hypothetical protein